MTTLSPSRNHVAIYALRGTSEKTLDRLSALINSEFDALESPLVGVDHIAVCVHDGLDMASPRIGPAVHVSIDLPEITVSPVLDAPNGLCTSCYRLRRRQHATDPRLLGEGSIDVFEPRVDDVAVTTTILTIVAKQVVASMQRWVERPTEATFSLYRVPTNHLITGSVLPYTNCPCAGDGESSEESNNGR